MLIVAVNLKPTILLSLQIDETINENSPFKRRLTGICDGDLGVGFKAEFFENFEWMLNWMKQIFIFAIQKFFCLIHSMLYSELFWVHSAIHW
jgi:hypothetical protein